MTRETITNALCKLKHKILTTKTSCSSSFLMSIDTNNEDNTDNNVCYMLESFIEQIDKTIMAECKHEYYETLIPSKQIDNISIRVTKCHNCSTIFPYSHSKL